MAVPICLVLERQAAERALSRAWAKTGKRMAARMAIMAMTTRSSISVNPGRGPQRYRIGVSPFYGVSRPYRATIQVLVRRRASKSSASCLFVEPLPVVVGPPLLRTTGVEDRVIRVAAELDVRVRIQNIHAFG